MQHIMREAATKDHSVNMATKALLCHLYYNKDLDQVTIKHIIPLQNASSGNLKNKIKRDENDHSKRNVIDNAKH